MTKSYEISKKLVWEAYQCVNWFIKKREIIQGEVIALCIVDKLLELQV